MTSRPSSSSWRMVRKLARVMSKYTLTDSGFLTILQYDEGVGGLEVMDTLLVNLGDMATVWSNGRLCNVKHRVQCKEA
ncbi:putative oxoglutarate/iron-dependent dioxygenase, isopenicillin N synthase [Helianthus debilis subsp. tardiflorus]